MNKNLDQIKAARQETHKAVQLVSFFPRNLLEHDPNDVSASLIWNDVISGFESQDINGVKVGFNLIDQTLLILKNFQVSKSIHTAHKSFNQVFEELKSSLEIEGFDSSRLKQDLPYELPKSVVNRGQPFKKVDAADLVKFYSLTQQVLTSIFNNVEEASEVRCWPHHYDLATLVTVEPHEDPEEAKSIGFGFSPGDGRYNEPYFYIAPWPYPPTDRLYEISPPAFWNTAGWTGGVLKAFDMDSGGDKEAVSEFFKTGLEKLNPLIMSNVLESIDAVEVAVFDALENRVPAHAQVSKTDLVVIRYENNVSVLYGRCLHRGAMLSDGFVDGDNLICGLHNWDYRIDTGVSEYNNSEFLHKFTSYIQDGQVYIDRQEILDYEVGNPSPFNEDEYLGKYADTHPEDTEPYTRYIKSLAQNGLSKVGHHGATEAMGVDRNTLPKWESIQMLPAQMAKKPLMDDHPVQTEVIIGPNAKKPLKLDIPIFVSDMSFGALSREAKIALSKGAEMAGTGICSGEGGMLPDEQAANSRYFYELASAKFGFSWDKLEKVQAFHFKGGQGAKTGTGGHLPGNKVIGEIAEVRGLNEGESAISPPTFKDMSSLADFKEFGNKVREVTGGIPVGYKLAASRIEDDIDFALDAGADYIILDGRGGGTGAAPIILRNHINVPTIPALARARKHLDKRNTTGVSLIITGGLRVPSDFAKALAMGADAIAVSNSALQAIGCLGMRACHTNNCPVGIATQKESLRSRLLVENSAKQLNNFFSASVDLMKVLARACGHDDFTKFSPEDLSTFDRDIYHLTGIQYAGVNP